MASGEIGEHRWSWAGGALHAVRLDDETAAFHEATASTHVFDEDTYRLVETLRLMGCDLAGTDLWRAAFGDSPSERDRQALDESMQALVQAGLVTANLS